MVEKGSGAARDGEEDEDEEHTVVNELPNKVDEFLDYVNRLYFDNQLDLGTKTALKADLKQKKEGQDKEEEEEEEGSNKDQDESDEVDEDWEKQLAEAERLGDAYFGM